ncbi:MAG: CUB domain-containing protein, partial [Flavobacteriales bacterium]
MSNTTVNISCGSVINFYDSGGPSASYSANANLTMVFCAPVGQNIYAQFSSFNMENNWDFLYIYNGPNTASPLVGVYTGSVSPGTVLGASNCLTFVFVSDNSLNLSGWTALVGCGTPPPPPPPASGLCSGAQPFCTGTTYTFPASQNTTAQAGPNYGCLLSAPNPAWYYMQIQNGGPLSIAIASTAGVDVDYALWGPFSTLTN